MSDPSCPCHSGKPYATCCAPHHSTFAKEGKLTAPTALALMRSRYSAYALDLPDYIIATTHPQNPRYTSDFPAWREEIRAFSQTNRFDDLTISEFTEIGPYATVTFTANLTPLLLHQAGRGVPQSGTFTEKSTFEKIGDNWLYLSAKWR